MQQNFWRNIFHSSKQEVNFVFVDFQNRDRNDRNFRRSIDNHTSLEGQKLQVPSSYMTGPGKGGKEVRKGSNVEMHNHLK